MSLHSIYLHVLSSTLSYPGHCAYLSYLETQVSPFYLSYCRTIFSVHYLLHFLTSSECWYIAMYILAIKQPQIVLVSGYQTLNVKH